MQSGCRCATSIVWCCTFHSSCCSSCLHVSTVRTRACSCHMRPMPRWRASRTFAGRKLEIFRTLGLCDCINPRHATIISARHEGNEVLDSNLVVVKLCCRSGQRWQLEHAPRVLSEHEVLEFPGIYPSDQMGSLSSSEGRPPLPPPLPPGSSPPPLSPPGGPLRDPPAVFLLLFVLFVSRSFIAVVFSVIAVVATIWPPAGPIFTRSAIICVTLLLTIVAMRCSVVRSSRATCAL
jgi:hypothetical protein